MEIGRGWRELSPDGPLECEGRGVPLFAFPRGESGARLGGANHHHATAREPADAARLRMVDNWIAKRGAQLHVQHERWGTDDLKGRDKRDN